MDVSRADAPAVVLGEQVIEAKGQQVPFRFEIPYDAAKIDANHTYAVQARIEVDGQLRFINDQRCAVITRGALMEADVVVKQVGAAPHDGPSGRAASRRRIAHGERGAPPGRRRGCVQPTIMGNAPPIRPGW